MNPKAYPSKRRWALILIPASLAMQVVFFGMRGSAFPPIGYFLLSWILPLGIYWILIFWKPGRFRPELCVLLTYPLIFGLFWMGKHPSPQAAFMEITGKELPAEARIQEVTCGWYDGRITMVRFQVDLPVLHRLLDTLETTVSEDPDRVLRQSLLRFRDGEEESELNYRAQWEGAAGMLKAASSHYVHPLPWSKPHQSHWIRINRSGGQHHVSLLWDEASGDVLAYSAGD